MASIRDRLRNLEKRRRFLDWFVGHRFHATLTLEELERCASGGGYPDPVPNRPSSVDTLDRKTLRKLWEKDELKFGGRSEPASRTADCAFVLSIARRGMPASPES